MARGGCERVTLRKKITLGRVRKIERECSRERERVRGREADRKNLKQRVQENISIQTSFQS